MLLTARNWLIDGWIVVLLIKLVGLSLHEHMKEIRLDVNYKETHLFQVFIVTQVYQTKLTEQLTTKHTDGEFLLRPTRSAKQLLTSPRSRKSVWTGFQLNAWNEVFTRYKNNIKCPTFKDILNLKHGTFSRHAAEYFYTVVLLLLLLLLFWVLLPSLTLDVVFKNIKHT